MAIRALKGFLLWGNLVISLVMSGCRATAVGPDAVPIDSVRATIAYLALGDSYTIGEGVAVAERWPMLLAVQAREAGIPLEDPRIIARTGWTTGELASAIDAARPDSAYGLVSLLVGVNDQYRGRPLEGYRAEFDALLLRAIGFAGGRPDRVLVLSIPDWGASFYGRNSDPAAIAAEIDAFNAANREIAAARGAGYVDVTQASREAAGDAGRFAPDGLHYSGAMHADWARAALRALPGAIPRAAVPRS